MTTGPLPPGVEPGADMFDIPGVGAFFLLPDPVAPDDRYVHRLFISARPGATWTEITDDEIAPLMLSGSWMVAEAILARRRPNDAMS